MKTRVQKWGNSLALRIPKSYADEVGLKDASAVDVSLVKGRLVVAPVAAKSKFTLKQLLAQVTKENLHHEIDTGSSVGERSMVSSKSYVPKRGDAVWITFNPQAGHEQAGRRPAVVLSPEAYNAKVGLAVFCPITSHKKGYPFEVEIPAGLAVSGVILSDQVKNLDWRARDVKLICTLPNKVISESLQKLEALLAK